MLGWCDIRPAPIALAQHQVIYPDMATRCETALACRPPEPLLYLLRSANGISANVLLLNLTAYQRHSEIQYFSNGSHLRYQQRLSQIHFSILSALPPPLDLSLSSHTSTYLLSGSISIHQIVASEASEFESIQQTTATG